jgi:DNA-binding NarL/FixJ family response regulator
MLDGTNSRVRGRVLIAVGAELVSRGIRDALAGDERYQVVGELTSAETLAASAAALRPDVVLLGLDGGDDRATEVQLGWLRTTLARLPSLRVIVLVEGEAGGYVLAAVQAGAQGVLRRDVPAMAQALADVLDGGAVIDTRLARSLFAAWRAGLHTRRELSPGEKVALSPVVLRELSPREQEVLRSLAMGYRNKEIAAQLGVSVGTVKTHLRHIFRKLTVSDRTSAVLTALQARVSEAA